MWLVVADQTVISAQVLVVRGRKVTGPSPPFCGVQGLATSDQTIVEGDGKACG